MAISKSIKKIYDALLSSFGPQHWWPGDTPFEIMVGAVLTQNTNWGNVEKAITQLKRQGILTVEAMRDLSVDRLAEAIRPAGYFNVKAKRLKNLIDYLIGHYGGDIRRMKREPLEKLRRELLAVNGVGPETADSILLYALDKPIFVVDAYTRRFLRRHNLIGGQAEYHDIQKMFMDALPADALVYNEYHALIVRLGKETCRPSARCEACPLNRIHYAMADKCAHCHRAFLRKEKTYSVGDKGSGRLLCSECQAVAKSLRRPPARWG
jgi:endonuclease III related protein